MTAIPQTAAVATTVASNRRDTVAGVIVVEGSVGDGAGAPAMQSPTPASQWRCAVRALTSMYFAAQILRLAQSSRRCSSGVVVRAPPPRPRVTVARSRARSTEQARWGDESRLFLSSLAPSWPRPTRFRLCVAALTVSFGYESEATAAAVTLAATSRS